MFLFRGTDEGGGGFEVCRTVGIKRPRVVEVIIVVKDENFAQQITYQLDNYEVTFGIIETKKFIENCKKFLSLYRPPLKIDVACDLSYTIKDDIPKNDDTPIEGEFPLSSSTRMLN